MIIINVKLLRLGLFIMLIIVIYDKVIYDKGDVLWSNIEYLWYFTTVFFLLLLIVFYGRIILIVFLFIS